MDSHKKEAIILIHGIWMNGFELFYLRYKLWRLGYRVYKFRYPSIFNTPEENAAKLAQFVSRIDEPVLHFVAHSLGGIIVKHLFHTYEIKQSGSVVMIGSPINGSAVANHVNEKKFLRYLLGKSIVNGLLSGGPDWNYKRKICIIAGTNGLGIGKVIAPKVMSIPNDGTVNFGETVLENADEAYEVPRSHFLLLFSNKVVNIVLQFLKK